MFTTTKVLSGGYPRVDPSFALRPNSVPQHVQDDVLGLRDVRQRREVDRRGGGRKAVDALREFVGDVERREVDVDLATGRNHESGDRAETVSAAVEDDLQLDARADGHAGDAVRVGRADQAGGGDLGGLQRREREVPGLELGRAEVLERHELDVGLAERAFDRDGPLLVVGDGATDAVGVDVHQRMGADEDPGSAADELNLV